MILFIGFGSLLLILFLSLGSFLIWKRKKTVDQKPVEFSESYSKEDEEIRKILSDPERLEEYKKKAFWYRNTACNPELYERVEKILNDPEPLKKFEEVRLNKQATGGSKPPKETAELKYEPIDSNKFIEEFNKEEERNVSHQI